MWKISECIASFICNVKSCHILLHSSLYTPIFYRNKTKRWREPDRTFLQATLLQYGAQNVSFWHYMTGCLFSFFSLIFRFFFTFCQVSNIVFLWGSEGNEGVEEPVSHPRSAEQDFLYSGSRLYACTDEQLGRLLYKARLITCIANISLIIIETCHNSFLVQP